MEGVMQNCAGMWDSKEFKVKMEGKQCQVQPSRFASDVVRLSPRTWHCITSHTYVYRFLPPKSDGFR